MSGRDQFTDPWGITAAAIMGGLAAAVTAALAPSALIALPVGAAVGAGVYGVHVALATLSGRVRGAGAAVARSGATRAGDDQLPAPPPGSDAALWLRRAEQAVHTLRQQTESPADAVLRGQIGDVDDQAAAALVELRRFAGQVTVVKRAAARVDAPRLRRESAALAASVAAAPAGPIRDEYLRSQRAIEDQLDVVRRLNEARDMLLVRMQSAALGLEGLVARLSELLALHATTEGGSLTAVRVSELASDLEGMRAGLTEAAKVSAEVMSRVAGPGPTDQTGRA